MEAREIFTLAMYSALTNVRDGGGTDAENMRVSE